MMSPFDFNNVLIFVRGHRLFLGAHIFPRLRRTVRFSNQFMSAEKFPIMLSRQMEANAYIYRSREQLQQQQQQANQQKRNYRKMLSMPKISSILQEMKIGLKK